MLILICGMHILSFVVLGLCSLTVAALCVQSFEYFEYSAECWHARDVPGVSIGAMFGSAFACISALCCAGAWAIAIPGVL